MADTQLRDHILDVLDQTDSNDRLILPATVDQYITRSRILDNKRISNLIDPLSNSTDVTYNEDNKLVTITMTDLFYTETGLERQTYIFEPILYLHPTGFTVLVDGTAADEADYTWDAIAMQLTFTAAHSTDVTVKIKGHLVDITKALRLSISYLRHKLATTPDIFGSYHKEWEVRLSQLEAEYHTADPPSRRLW